MKKRKMDQRGFTLIELLITVIIIGILASVVFASIGRVKEKGNNAKRVADMEQIEVALKVYRSVNPDYPDSDDGNMSNLSALLPNYIGKIPEDPLNRNGYAYQYMGGHDSSGDSYIPAECPGSQYVLGYRLEGDSNGNANGCGGDSADGYYIIYK